MMKIRGWQCHSASPSATTTQRISQIPRFPLCIEKSGLDRYCRCRSSVVDTTGSSASASGMEDGQRGRSSNHVAMSSDVEEGFWRWTVPGSKLETKIRYFKAGPPDGKYLLLLHGFGVGSYHYERNIPELVEGGCRVFAVDILGQGSSWPVRPVEPDDQLYISIDTWRCQLRDFAQDVMGLGNGRTAFVAGNSLGGLLAVYLAAMHPDLVRGLILLNATPFWSFRPSLSARQSQGLWGLAPPGFGTVPVPQGLKHFIENVWWNNLRRPETVRGMLQLVYSEPAAVDEDTVKRILEATKQPLALDIFSAIALAPKPELGFEQCLDLIQSPILMIYGRDDPWVVPLWGQRLKRRVTSAVYLELSPAGHCPHHEAPRAVDWALLQWIASDGKISPIAEGASMDIQEDSGSCVRIVCRDGSPNTVPSNWISLIVTFLEGIFKDKKF